MDRRRYAHQPPTLVFDLLNEPCDKLTPARWNVLAPELLAAVREVDGIRQVLVGPAGAGTIHALDELELPEDEHLGLTFHYYEPMPFTHQGAWWEPGAQPWLGTRWGSPQDRATVIAHLEEVARYADQRHVQAWMGEYGTIDAAPRADRIMWTTSVQREATRLGIGTCLWSLGGEFGVLASQGWDNDLVEASLGVHALRPESGAEPLAERKWVKPIGVDHGLG